MIPIPKIIKKWRLTGRFGGSAYYTDEGGGLLIIGADGTRLTHIIEGVDFSKSMGGSTGSPAPVADIEPPQPVQDRGRDTPVVEREPLAGTPTESATRDATSSRPEPAPEPVSPIDRHAQQVARSVWSNGGIHRSQLFPRGMRRSAQDELLAYAVNRGWLAVSEDDGMVKPGVKNPIPVMPQRSRSEQRTAWGPGPGARW